MITTLHLIHMIMTTGPLGTNKNQTLLREQLDTDLAGPYPPLLYRLTLYQTHKNTNKQVSLLVLHLNPITLNYILPLIKTNQKNKKYSVHLLSLKALPLTNNVKEEELYRSTQAVTWTKSIKAVVSN